MPRLRGRGGNIGRRIRTSQGVHTRRLNRATEDRLAANINVRNQIANTRANESHERRTERLQANALRQREMRQRATDATRAHIRQRQQVQRTLIRRSFLRLAFEYESDIDYSSHSQIVIGAMDIECEYCHALKYKGESRGFCCASGKVVLPPLNSPPEPLKTLLAGATPQSKLFLRKIRKFNSCFQMTSFGATKIVQNADGHNFESTFKIQGQVYHQIGSLISMPDAEPKFLQIYFMGDEEQQINTRCQYNHIEQMEEREIVATLEPFLKSHNQLLRLFNSVSNRLRNDNYMVVIRADKVPSGEHAGRYNAPTINEVAVVLTGDAYERRDIRIKRRDNTVQTIQDSDRSYDAFQYPLIFWEGEDGYHFNIKQRNPATGAETNKKVSAMNFYAYRLMIRANEDNNLLRCRQLYHQYIVDMYAKIESERLRYIRYNQAKLRSEEYIHLRDAVVGNVDGTTNINDIGTAFILPSSYIGSPRHMQEYIQDAMTFVRAYGRPDLFITFTCNPNWEEIKNSLLPGQTSIHRHDITARVFKQKLKSLINLITRNSVFGETRCWLYSVEWQKRGLPHAHILIWVVNKVRPEEIDKIISAEIPDQNDDPELFDIVTANMIHGPCGGLNGTAPCMDNGKCTKRFPKAFTNDTITNIDGYPLYRRRDTDNGGLSYQLHKSNGATIDIDNRWVVPYSPLLSKIYKAHINVELCNSVKSIKYICKYIHKGSDMAIFSVQNISETDEITRYQMGRYISSNEAVWRILSFPIHERDPAVIHLAVHLENGQRVYFTEETALQRALIAPKTTLTEFFQLCNRLDIFGQFARTLLYNDVPRFFVWNKQCKKWNPRKRGVPVEGYNGIFMGDTLGRLYTVHPKQRECFFLRLLLVNVVGPTSFQYLRTVSGIVYETYHDACRELHLLEDDNHWDLTLADAVVSSSPHQIRHLFAILLTTCFPSNAFNLWDKYKNSMSEDILHRIQTANQFLNIDFTPEIYNEALIKIEEICISISSLPLSHYHMPSPNRVAADIINNDVQREQNYDTAVLTASVANNEQLLTAEQKTIYDRINSSIAAQRGGFFFLDAPGGTGKTFLISLILARIRSEGHIALAIASSGIAATLLDGGRTAHSALKLPLNVHKNPDAICNIKKHSGMAKVLQKCKIIIWDECTMAHKYSLEALDRTMKDLNDNARLFGGALLLLSGDFRQILPVIQRGTYADEINACLKQSYLWRHVNTVRLTTNMRVHLQNDSMALSFSEQLLNIGNGRIPLHENTKFIKFPDSFCNMVDTKDDLIESVFPNLHVDYINHAWLCQRVILAAKNIDVDVINSKIQQSLPGNEMSFKSIDTVVEIDEAINYPVEFLNSLDLPGMPPHNLRLKVGSPIILLRNLNPPKLCNGTRLVLKRIMNNVLEATILTGKFQGDVALLPRIPMIPSDSPIPFKRLQFPIRLAFAMTINKSQGQTMSVCGIDLESTCFSHGQLYVACSRVGKPSSLFIYAPQGLTRNIVHQLALT